VGAEAAVEPLARQAGRRGEGAAVEAVDDLNQAILLLAVDGADQLSHPRALAVALAPRPHRVGEHVQLHAPLAGAGPDVGQRAAQLRVPQQGRQVVERDGHADVVDRAVGQRPDRHVGG